MRKKAKDGNIRNGIKKKILPEFDDFELDDQYEIDEKYFPAAERDIRQLYENNKDGIYYTRQLQIKFEKAYFPWTTYRVIRHLNDLDFLILIERPQKDATSISFYTHYSNRYPKRKINKLEEIIGEFSQDHITRSCGQRAEDLFCLGLVKKGFKVTGQKVKEYNGKKWTKTGHDLDFVFEKDGICYGCEIKNTLGYIGKEELDIKMKTLRPLGRSFMP